MLFSDHGKGAPVRRMEESILIKRLYVDKFKALNSFHISLEQFTVIVGNNMSGKSTILQVLDFISSLTKEDFSVILERRGWKVSDIKSQLEKSQTISFSCEMELPVGSKCVSLCWDMHIFAYAQKNILRLGYEHVSVCNGNVRESLLFYAPKSDDNFIQNGDRSKKVALPKLQMNSSLLKVMDFSEYPILQALKDFWKNSDSFELLSPEKMRLSSRGDVNTIGSAGEKLPSFIKSMDQEQKRQFSDKIKKVLGDRLVHVDAKTKGKPGWTQLIAEEKYDTRSLMIESRNMSDGTLRLLAFLAICEIDKKGVMLLDEIENGINIDYAEQIIHILNENCKDKNSQMIVTTHSPIFLDYVEKNHIRYMYRDSETGFCKCSVLADNTELNEKMNYLYPGELFMNMSNSEIIDKLLGGGDVS